jgi:hypothetical protein
MKKLLLMLLLISPIYCFAQTDSLKFKPKEEFCEVKAVPNYAGYQLRISEKNEKSDKMPWLKNADNKVRQFYSMVGVLNYMAQYGWILVTTYNDVTRGNSDDIHLLYKRSL